MTTDEVRDGVASLLGWGHATNWEVGRWEKGSNVVFSHPIPDTIDGVAKLMPEGWAYHVWMLTQHGRVKGDAWVPNSVIHTRGKVKSDAPTEYEARLRLLHAVLLAARGAGREGQGE